MFYSTYRSFDVWESSFKSSSNLHKAFKWAKYQDLLKFPDVSNFWQKVSIFWKNSTLKQ